MVKGTSKRVIVVRSPDPDCFEEAIFIVKDDSELSKGITKDRLLAEACRAAESCIGEKHKRGVPTWLVVSISALCGCGAAFMLLKLFGG